VHKSGRKTSINQSINQFANHEAARLSADCSSMPQLIAMYFLLKTGSGAPSNPNPRESEVDQEALDEINNSRSQNLFRKLYTGKYLSTFSNLCDEEITCPR